MNRKNKVQESPRKVTWTSWKRDEDNHSSITARQGQRAYPRWKGDKNKSLHIDMPVEKKRNSTKVGPTKTYNIKGKLEFRRMDEEAKLGTYHQKSHVP